MVRYKMIGLDINAAPIDRGRNSPPTQYRTWVVEGQPDFTGQYYTGEKSGTTPLQNVTAYTIFDDSLVCDFNLPNPLDWDNTYSVLPAPIYDSQLAIIDGYAYLFGGVNDGYIYRASLNTPTVWTNTGAMLPTSLGGSQLAIIGNTIYLFGGQTGISLSSATDTIYSAPLSNPLNWTNNGSLLPRKLSHSQLFITDSNVYLVGGYEPNNSSDVILSAPISNPLAWTDTTARLPHPTYGSQLAVIDGYAYLLGGLLAPQTPDGYILSAKLSNPTFWYDTGDTLPYPVCFGQFCTIGDQGYLFTQGTNSTVSETLILQCQLNLPTLWKDTGITIPGTVSQSQLAIIYDRIWLFGGNGSTVIFSCNSIIKWPFVPPTSPPLIPNYNVAIAYGNTTRTEYQAAAGNPLNLTNVICFPYWKTDYAT